MTPARRPLLLLLAVAALFAMPAAAKAEKAEGCAKAIIADWFDNNRIDKIYKPLSCYRKAIAALPTDVKEYTEAAEDIRRAWALARKGKEDTGPTDGSTGSDADPDDAGGAGGPGAGQPGPGGPGVADGGPGTANGGLAPEPGDDGTAVPGSDGIADPSESSSVPIPLIVLAALALLLLLAGGAGYLRRRGDVVEAEASQDPA